MDILKLVVWIVNIFSAIALIVLVLAQHGKGADAGAAFGSGSAQGVFGSAGSSNFLSRSTAISAFIFFASCLALGYFSAQGSEKLDFNSVTQPAAVEQVVPAPADKDAVIPE